MRANIRRAAVAGAFYPSDPRKLAQQVDDLLSDARAQQRNPGPPPKALIAPHAAYVYSGPIAACAYVRLDEIRHRIRRVVVVGPAHRVAFEGLAGSSASAFATPLGEVACEPAAAPHVRPLDEAHSSDHCIEVQLPLLIRELGRLDFVLVPLLVSRATTVQVEAALEKLWGGDETLIVVSSDLSHYHSYDEARQLDRATAAAVVAQRPGDILDTGACGCVAIRGLIAQTARRSLSPQLLDLRNSGDTRGPRDRVVGYGAFAFA